MKNCYHLLWFGAVLILLLGLLYHRRYRDTPVIDEYVFVQKVPAISADYTETVIPPNIAPLNFVVKEQGCQYCVKIYSTKGASIDVFSKTGRIVIPIGPWKKLLNTNRGEKLYFDIYAKDKTNQWIHFETITNRIAGEDVDGFLVYRKIHPSHSRWGKMGIYQRHLNSFSESVVLENGYFKRGCVNCHAFCGHRAEKMLIGIRSENYGSSALLLEGDTVQKIGTKFGYTSWHPSGQVAVFSVNKVRQIYHSAASEVRDVVDLDSVMAYYLVGSKTVKSTGNLTRKDRLETYPTWSADGRTLYFCSAPMTWSDRTVVPESYDQIQYDLVRIRYDLDRDQWGPLESVLSARQTGLSILLPRVSPDGRWLLFCMCDYGCFPVYRPSSDLYMMDLEAAQQTGKYKYRRLDINSDKSESWHSWSSNGRWIVFSSKRDSDVFTRIYIAYVDRNGKVYKPIRLPQKDPMHYESCLWTYSVPELVTEPVRITKEKLGRVVRSSRKIPIQMPVTMATPKAGQVTSYEDQLQERE